MSAEFDAAVQNGVLSADSVAVGFVGTQAEKTRAVIERALEALIANNVIALRPVEEWNKWYVIDPPYESWMS